MKKLTMPLALVVAIGVLSGCHFRVGNSVVGSGKRQTEKREVPAFTSISTEGAFDIEVVCQKPASLEVEADDNILSLVSTEVSNNVLQLRPKQNFRVSEPVKIRIAMPDIEELSTTGAGDIQVSGVKNQKFTIEANGASMITVSGDTETLNIDASGAGKIDAHKLHAARAFVDAKGVASIDLYAKDQLDVTISGPSHVTYWGDPKVNKTVHGPGSVEKKESSPA